MATAKNSGRKTNGRIGNRVKGAIPKWQPLRNGACLLVDGIIELARACVFCLQIIRAEIAMEEDSTICEPLHLSLIGLKKFQLERKHTSNPAPGGGQALNTSIIHQTAFDDDRYIIAERTDLRKPKK